jgi:hypothetical protein
MDGYELEFEDTFDGDALDTRRWHEYYLSHWSSRERTAARYRLGDGRLRLLIEAGQEPWCREFDGDIKVSCLQTGAFSGPLGSSIGQNRFRPDLVVREEQENVRLYTPQYGRVETRLQALANPRNMVALWMGGYADRPERSGEILVCEIFGRDVRDGEAGVGMGVRKFDDPQLVDEVEVERLPIDAREFHVYAADWSPEQVSFSVDGEHVKTVRQSPDYPLQLWLGIYEFPPEDGAAPDDPSAYPKEFVVDYVRGYRRSADVLPSS